MLKRLVLGIGITILLMLLMMFVEVLVLVLFDAPVPHRLAQILLMAFMGLASAAIVSVWETRA